MTLLEALVYGVIQGVSEFLPISSSGHLALLPHVMKIQDPGVVFDLMMHFGTALAVITYFRIDIIRYAKTFNPALVSISKGTPEQWFVRNFTVATFFSVLGIVLLLPVSKMARSPNFIIFNLCFFGLVLWISDMINRKKQVHLDEPFHKGMEWKLAIIIGLSQAIAIFPGVSRSGITLSAALLLGIKRKEAGSFSFLMSLPIILAGIFKEIPELMHSSVDHISVLLVGIVASFVVGLLTIHFFMKLLSKIQLGWFTLYRWGIALLLFWIL